MRRAGILAPLLCAVLAVEAAGGQAQLESLYEAGREAFLEGRAYEAMEALGAVAAEAPDYRDVQMLLGQACLVADLLREAKRHFERALDADPTNGHAAFLLGLTLYQAARYFEAAEALDRACLLAPQNPHPLIYRGLAHLRLGRPAEARADIEDALARAPNEPSARVALAELELAHGRFEQAEASAREAMAAAPGLLEARILLGRILLEAGRPAEAVTVFQEILGGIPARSELLYLLAQALLRSGQAAAGTSTLARFKEQRALEEQVKVMEAELSVNPRDVETRIRLVRLLLDHRLVGSLPHHLAQLQRLRPGDPRVSALVAEWRSLGRASP